MYKKVIVILFFVVLAGTACSHVTPDPGKEGIDQARIEKDELKDRMKNDHRDKPKTQLSDEYYMGSGVKYEMHKKENLPSLFDKKITIVERPLYLYQIANKISALSNVPVYVPPSLRKIEEKNNEGESVTEYEKYDPYENVDEDNRGESDKTNKPILLFNDNLNKISLSFEGTLEDLLNKVASHFGLFWEYEEGKIEFREVDTSVYSIATSIGDVNSQGTMTNKSGNDSGGQGEERGGAENEEMQENSVEYKYSIMNEVEENIKNMLSEKGDVRISSGSGTVKVTDTPSVLNQVDKYVDQINDKLSRQVSIDVKVFALDSEESSSIGYDLKAIFEDLNGEFGAKLNPISPTNSASGMGELSAMILDTADESNRALGQWSGSELFLEALERRGDVSLVTSASGIILNNQTFPIQNLKKTAYLAETEITLSGSGGDIDTASLTPGEVTTGFSMTASPHIMPNNSVFLQYNISLSALDDLKEFESHGSTIQTPEVSSRSFMQRVKMNLGSTLILAGFERAENNKSNEKGLFGFMGKSDSSSKKKDMIIITMTVNDLG